MCDINLTLTLWTFQTRARVSYSLLVFVCVDLHGRTSWSGFFPPFCVSIIFHREKMSIPAKRITQWVFFFICQASLSYCSTWTREMYSSLDNNTRWWRYVCLAAAARIAKRMRNVDQLDIIPACCVYVCFSTHFFLPLLMLFVYFHFAVLRSKQTREMLRWTSWRVCMFPAQHRGESQQPTNQTWRLTFYSWPSQLRLLTNKNSNTQKKK